MAKSVNRVTLIGNLGKDPEVKYTPQGTPVARFSLATTENYKDKAGAWQERTEWHNIVLWQRLAEIAGEYLKKGSKVYLEGRIHYDSWEDKQSGEKKYKTEIVVNDLVLLGSRQGGGAGEGGGGGFSKAKSAQAGGGGGNNNFDQSAPAQHDEMAQTGGITDEDIPF